jgi:HK97 family phage portal protein
LKFKVFGKEIELSLRKSIQNSALPAMSDEAAWINYLKGAGYAVSHDTALKVAVVIRCADVVAKTMASLGCHLYKETDNGKERAKGNNLYRLLRYMPNAETTAYDFFHMYIFNLMLTKGAFAKVVRDQNGFIKELWNIPSNRVMLDRNLRTGERYIDVYHDNGKIERLYEAYFMYTPGLRFSNSEKTEDFIKIAGDVLGLTMNLNNYADDYFKNGSNLGGFISYPAGINDTAFKKFRDDWSKAYSGVVNQHKYAILEGGFDIKKFDSNPEQSQALESRKFQVLEVCRIMGVPPSKVFELERSTYNNIEQSNIEYVNESLSPMSERITQTVYKDLLTSSEQKKHYAKFNLNALLRGDIESRTAYYHSARQDGWMSANDIRELEEMNMIPAEEGGDVYAINGNMIPLTAVPLNLPKGAQNAGNNK